MVDHQYNSALYVYIYMCARLKIVHCQKSDSNIKRLLVILWNKMENPNFNKVLIMLYDTCFKTWLSCVCAHYYR